jgi:hypothetical protein
VSKLLALLQRFVAADKAAVTTALVAGLALIAVHFGMKLNASDMSYLGILAVALEGAFLHAHFSVTRAPAPAGEHEKP